MTHTRQVAELEKLEVDPLDLQDQVRAQHLCIPTGPSSPAFHTRHHPTNTRTNDRVLLAAMIQVDLRRLEAERQGMTEEQLKEQIEAKLLADKVLDLLASHAQITYVDAKEV